MIKKIIIILLITFSINSYADSKKINNVEAEYIFYYKNMKAGTMSLKINSKDDEVKISTIYDGNFLAELANKGYRAEVSYLKRKNDTLIPVKYLYKDNKDSYEVTFKNKNIEILGIDQEKIIYDVNEIIYDPISMLVILMQDFPNVRETYKVLSKKNIKNYNYNYKKSSSKIINGKEYTGYSAEYNSGNKTNYFFFSKNHNNLMVFTSIRKKGKEKIRIELLEIKNSKLK